MAMKFKSDVISRPLEGINCSKEKSFIPLRLVDYAYFVRYCLVLNIRHTIYPDSAVSVQFVALCQLFRT